MKTYRLRGLLVALVAASSWALAQPPEEAADACRPAADSAQAQYVIGYGSLMDTESRRRTLPEAGEGVPVRVDGYERYWGLNGPRIGFGTTFLMARPLDVAEMNAVVFGLPDATALEAYDARESRYCRALVPRDQLRSLSLKELPNGQFWIYMKPEPTGEQPSERYPIVQSYVDLLIGGCLEIQERFELAEFAEDCVETTQGWSSHWVNDRLQPRRPWVHQPRAMSIDRVLSGALPELYPGEVEIE